MRTTTTKGTGRDGDDPMLLQGVWAAVPTPFLQDGQVDLEGIAGNVRRFRDTLGLHGLFCNGLMGEQWSLTHDERMRILEASVTGADGRIHIGVVVSAASLTETTILAEHASGAGAHHIVLMRPAGFTREHEIEPYVRAVAAASKIPLVLFDGGIQTGGFSPGLIARLAHDGLIQGVKCTRGDDAAEALRAACTAPVPILDPYEAHWLNNLLRFDLRTLYADPEPYLYQPPDTRLMADYFDAYARGELGEAARLFRQLEPIRRLYHRWIMGPLQHGHPVNAVLKRWFGHMGFAAGPVRAPLSELSEEQGRLFDAELKAVFRQVYGDSFTFAGG